MSGRDGSGDLQVRLATETGLMLVVREHVEQVLRHAGIRELLPRQKHRQHAGAVIVHARLCGVVPEARRRVEEGVQVGIARGCEKMRIWLVVELDLGTLDVGQGFLQIALPRGHRPRLLENSGGYEQPLVEQIEFDAELLQPRVLPQGAGSILP